jgi:hypothetical protein
MKPMEFGLYKFFRILATHSRDNVTVDMHILIIHSIFQIMLLKCI